MILKEKLYINGSLVFPSLEDAAAAYRESYLEMAQEKLVQAIETKDRRFFMPECTPASVIDEIKQCGYDVEFAEYFNVGYAYQISGWEAKVTKEDASYENNIREVVEA